MNKYANAGTPVKRDRVKAQYSILGMGDQLLDAL